MKKLLLSILLLASFVFVGLPMNLSQANAASYKLVWYIVIAGVSALAVGAITYFVVGYIERKKGCK